MNRFRLALLLAMAIPGQAAAQAPVRVGDFGGMFLIQNPACNSVVHWLTEGVGPTYKLPVQASPSMQMFNLMQGRNRKMQALITDEGLARLHPEGAPLTTLEALETMSASVDACRPLLTDQPGGVWVGSLAAGARDLAMLRQAEAFFPEELAEATKGPGSGRFRSLTVPPRPAGPPRPKLTAAERVELRKRTEAAMDRSYLPEPIPGADQAAVMNGTADRLGIDEVHRALVVVMQADVPKEHLTKRGYRLMHPDMGMIGVNQVKSVNGVECEPPRADGAVACHIEITTYTSLEPETMNRYARNGEGIARLFNADGVVERELSVFGTFKHGDRGWRVALDPTDWQRMISGEIQRGPVCLGISDSEAFFGCPPR